MIAKFLQKNPLILFLIICVILVSGIASFTVMPRLEDPVLGKRVAVISTVYPGADSRRIESLVTLKIEEELRGISQIKQVRSSSRTGISSIVVELHDDVDDVAPVWSLIRNEIENAEENLPAGCFLPQLDVLPLKAFAAIVAVTPRAETKPNFVILRRLAKLLRTKLANISGTESVQLFGDPGEEFIVDVRPETLASLNLSIAAIARQVSANNVTQPAGFLRESASELPLDLDAALRSTAALEQAFIRFGPSGQSCSLSDIAVVSRATIAPAETWAIVDGERSIVLAALVDDDLRVDQWSKQLFQVTDSFQDKYQADIDVEVIFSQSDYIEHRLKTLLRNLLIGTCAVIVVVLLLMGWRSMIVVGVSVPLSALMVLVGMRAMDIPIHQISVTGLIVALGLLIDNAIVIVEDMRIRLLAGHSPSAAITYSVGHLAMPLFGSTLTTALAFLPIATLPGPPGEFVGTLAVSVILAISASFLLAMTVVPALLSLTRFDPNRPGPFDSGISNKTMKELYARSLDLVFRYPPLGILLSIALPMLGFWVASDLPEQFFPPSDRNQIQVEIELPARESAAQTLATVQALQPMVAEHPQVARVHWFVGGNAPTFYYNVVPRRRATPFYAQAIIELRPSANGTDAVRSLQQTLDAHHAECRVVVRQLEQGPPFDAPIEIRVIGPDLQTLRRLGSQLRLLLSQTPHVIHTRSDLEESIPKLVVKVDPQASTRAGLSEAEIAQQLYTTLEGVSAGTILAGEEELPVRVKMFNSGDSQLEQIAALPIHSARLRGAPPPNRATRPPAPSPPLSALADFDLDSDMAAIIRIDGERTNEVKAYIQAGVLPSQVVAAFNRQLAKSDFQLPDGYSLSYGGERAERANALQGLIANAVVLFSLMVLTLVVSFRSFRLASIIAMVGGLAIGLGLLSLWLFGFPFGFMAIVGTMGLVGVAINDSIVVLAAIRENKQALAGDLVELRKVVVASTRHIVATTLTTIVGFLPLIVGGGDFWPPLAITVAGGVAGATFLALYFVPSMTLVLCRQRTVLHEQPSV